MSEEDEALLDKATRRLMRKLDLEGSDLLEQLGRRNALRPMQLELIKVPCGNLIFSIIVVFLVFVNYSRRPKKMKRVFRYRKQFFG